MIQPNEKKLLYFQSTMITNFLPGDKVLDKLTSFCPYDRTQLIRVESWLALVAAMCSHHTYATLKTSSHHTVHLYHPQNQHNTYTTLTLARAVVVSWSWLCGGPAQSLRHEFP